MDMETVDYAALLIKPLRWLAMLFALYVIAVVFIRLSGVLNRPSCPNCGKKLKRSKRRRKDKILKNVSFGILSVKRFRCYTCYWEGIGFRNDEKVGSENELE